MSHLNTVQFHLLPDGTLDCWFQYEGGATTSFDPAQLPDRLAEVLGPTLTAALAAKVAAESKASALQAENEAKDANIQEMMGEVEQMKGLLAKAEDHIAALSVYEAMAGLTPYKPAEELTVTTDADGNVEVTGSGTLSDKTFG